MSPDLLKQCLEVFDCKFAHGYGQTEATTALTFLPPEGHQRALADKPELLKSCGRAVYGSEIKIIDEQGNRLPVGEVGEILARGPQIMTGYWKRDEATAQTIVDDWLHTGDAGYVDEEGFFYIRDRVKDMIVSGGENIYPAEVENVLFAHPAIADVAVIGVPDAKFGEAPLAVCVLAPEQSTSDEALIEFCKAQLASYKTPRQYAFVEEIPRNPSGKVLKRVLREPYWQASERRVG